MLVSSKQFLREFEQVLELEIAQSYPYRSDQAKNFYAQAISEKQFFERTLELAMARSYHYYRWQYNLI